MLRSLLMCVAVMFFSGTISASPFPDVMVKKINDRVYSLHGSVDVPNKENGGYMNNNLVIIGDQGVVLVDAGSHRAVAEHIGKAIERITSKPVTHILVTHHHGDHHLGSVAFPDAKIVSSDYCARQIQDNGRGMVAAMKRMTGLYIADEPRVPSETMPQNARRTLQLNGVNLELITPQTAHTDGDMMVWLPDDRVLASGDILVHAINPNFVDGNLKKWIAVVDDILKMPIATVMPGHGALMQRQDVEHFRTIIADFYKAVEEIYKSGGAEADVRKKLDLAMWQKLARYDDMMGRNISKVWLEVEADNF